MGVKYFDCLKKQGILKCRSDKGVVRQLNKCEGKKVGEKEKVGKGGADKNESCWQERRGKQLRGF